MVAAADEDGSETLDFGEFVRVADRARTGTEFAKFNEVIKQQKATIMQVKKGHIVHSFDEEECAAFVDFINNKLGADEDLGPSRDPIPRLACRLRLCCFLARACSSLARCVASHRRRLASQATSCRCGRSATSSRA